MGSARGTILPAHRTAAAKFTLFVALAAMVLMGCSSSNGGTAPQAAAAADPNPYPANYKQQIATLLSTTLSDRAEFRAALIAPPALKQVGDNPHYIVCVQLNGHNEHRDKVAIYLAGAITQFIDAAPDQCAGAAYEPFRELATRSPS